MWPSESRDSHGESNCRPSSAGATHMWCSSQTRDAESDRLLPESRGRILIGGQFRNQLAARIEHRDRLGRASRVFSCGCQERSVWTAEMVRSTRGQNVRGVMLLPESKAGQMGSGFPANTGESRIRIGSCRMPEGQRRPALSRESQLRRRGRNQPPEITLRSAWGGRALTAYSTTLHGPAPACRGNLRRFHWSAMRGNEREDLVVVRAQGFLHLIPRDSILQQCEGSQSVAHCKAKAAFHAEKPAVPARVRAIHVQRFWRIKQLGCCRGGTGRLWITAGRGRCGGHPLPSAVASP